MSTKKSLKIDLMIGDTEIAIDRPYYGGGDNPRFFAEDFCKEANTIASEIEQMLIAKFGDYRK